MFSAMKNCMHLINCRDAVGEVEYVVETKIDGLSVSLSISMEVSQ